MLLRNSSRPFGMILAALCAFAVLAPVELPGQGTGKPKASPAATPVQRKDEAAVKRHKTILARVQKGDVDMVFLGDSITQGWLNKGQGLALWNARYQPLKAANLGVGSDGTQHALWRITKGGELRGVRPKLVVLMMGINNIAGGHKPEQVAEGIGALLRAIEANHPKTPVLLMGTFPAGKQATHKFRAPVKALNALLEKRFKGGSVRFLDIGAKFLDAKGTLTSAIGGDGIHLTEKGYKIWADEIQATVDQLVGKPKPPSNKGKLAWGQKVTPGFRTKVVAIAKEIGVDASDLMACMAFETGETFKADIVNKSSGATGLIQFMPSTAKGLGTTTDALKKMTAEQQLDYVRKYFLPKKGKLKNIDDLYMAILWPVAAGKADDYVLFSKGDKKTGNAYKLNAGLDKNKDGKVTKAEAASAPRAKLTKGQSDALASAMP